MSRLSHPNIASVFDAGGFEHGIPYIVMELVRGQPLTEYCDRQRLNVPQRLELFAQVSDAVHHAHERGILHRDIKPANVLVVEGQGPPTPKLIDFGIARAVHLSAAGLTKTGASIGTPAYMSPEQLFGDKVGPATDVYSLGVVLHAPSSVMSAAAGGVAVHIRRMFGE